MKESKLPESCEEHQSKYYGNTWKLYSLAELGQWVHLFVKRAHHRSDTAERAKDLTDAQNYLDMMQAHIDAAVVTGLMVHNVSEPSLPIEEAEVLKHMEPKTLLEAAQSTESAVIEEPAPKMVDRKGPPRDEEGNITRISVLPGDRGYDPDVHDNKDLKIYCNDVHIPTAHTADTVEGLVLFYDKDARGRIKTRELQGKVEIRGL